MAGYLSKRLFNLQKPLKYWTQSVKLKSDAHVVMTDDSSTVVFWHPEKGFPYEMSRPIPEKMEAQSDSVLNVQNRKEILSVLKPKRREVVIQELVNMTHTTKHYWYPRKQQFRRKKRIEPDREYL